MKRALSAILSTCLVFSCVAVSAAASFPDTASHWASATIEYMAGKKILNGYDDGNFHPNGYPDDNGSVEVNGKRYRGVTRAEFIKMLDETFGLSATTSVSYTDVATSDWFYPYVAKAAAQGYLLNYGRSLNPNGELSRQEAAALLVRYLDLDPSVKAEPSAYPDYNTIKTAYRDYVLMATAEGLFKGYDEDGTFRPDRILSRAEALTILYRAAGTIFSESARSADPAAAPANGVITQAGVTVENVNLGGRLIIGEGAAGGTVTLSNCEIGELIVRGTASVILSGCTVQSLTVDTAVSGFTSPISLMSQTEILSLELRTPADISLFARTAIRDLTVSEDAESSKVSGSGTLSTAEILAGGFKADMMPEKYTLGDGLTAVLNGKTYSGSSADVSQSGFKTAPSTYASATNCYLTGTTVTDGALYYYFTASSAIPTRDTFMNYYNVASVHASHAVTANLPRDTSIASTATVSEYPYVTVMLVDASGNKYQPIVIPNKASAGFTVQPTVSVSGSYQYLSYTPSEAGTLYYYYTTSSAVPTLSTFTANYNASTTHYKGTLSATANQSSSSPLQRATDVAVYPYIVVSLSDQSGTQYQPVVVSVAGSLQMTTSGFTTDPVLGVSGDSVSLTLTAETNGKAEFYFTTSSTVPTTAQFDQNFAAAGSNSGVRDLDTGRPYTILLTTMVNAMSYPYVVVRFSSSTAKYQPIVLKMSDGAPAVDITGSGFVSVPTLSVQNGYYYLTLPTNGQMQVYYYLTDSTSVGNSTVFMNNYNASISPYLSTKTGGVITSGYTSSIQTVIPSSMYGSYKYMALMATSGGTTMFGGAATSYTPIVIPLVSEMSSTTAGAGSGFISGPSYTIYRADAHQADFMTAQSGRVFYYYTDSNEATSGQELVGRILMGDLQSSDVAGYVDVTGYQASFISLGSGGSQPYLMMVFMDQNGVIYSPVYANTNGTSSYSGMTTGFNGSTSVTIQNGIPVLSYNLMESGTVYYFFTNSSAEPSDVNAFFTAYHSGSAVPKGSTPLTIGKGTANLTTSASASGYAYVVLIFQSAAGGTGGYYKPFVLQTNGTASGGTIGGTGSMGGGIASSAGFVGTPYLSGNSWGYATLHYTPLMSGTLYYAYTNLNSASEWLRESVTPIMSVMGSLGSTTTMNPQTLSMMVSQYGSGSSQTISSGTQQLSLSLNTSYSYLVVWVANSTTMSTPVFLSTSGTGTGTIPGGSTAYTNGFSSAPVYYPNVGILFTPGYSGTVRYILTNSNAAMTADEFEMYYGVYSSNTGIGLTGTTSVSANSSSLLPIANSSSGYKYCYVMLTSGSLNYLPYLVQLG